MKSALARYQTSRSGSHDPLEWSDSTAAYPAPAISAEPSSAPQSPRRPSTASYPAPLPAPAPSGHTVDTSPGSGPAPSRSSHNSHTCTAQSRPSLTPSSDL